jgi:DNA-binding SARP family transcriptional activator/tetratricopeptide (TPR) repeat protein
MKKLVVRLLGGFRVELDGEAVYEFETDKARALLAYLVVEANRPHRREALASLLWPERPDSVARTNLRQALARVRRALSDYANPPFLFVTSTDVQFNTASDHTVDVAELEAFASSPERVGQLLPAAFCADFLDGFAMPDSEVFEEWVLSRQEHYHRLAIETLDAQNAYCEGIGDYDQAAAAARLQLQFEPWLEEAHRRCMRALALAGRRDEALHQFELCCSALAAELGVKPAAGTQALYADILAERIAAPHLPSSVRLPGRPGPLPLPVRVVAREDELGKLNHHLRVALSGTTQVVFVSGDAGSGKTVLLEAFAASAMAQYLDLLVAGARTSPGGDLDPFAPLRKLTEMLCGDLSNAVAWRLADDEQVARLQRATGLVQSSLAEYGPALVETLVSAASLIRRSSFSLPGATTARFAGQPTWWAARPGEQSAAAHQAARTAPPTRDALFDQLSCTLAAIARSRPLLLLLDDLQWVDDSSAAFLLHVCRELSHSRLLILGAYRSATVALGRHGAHANDGEQVRHPLATVVNELRRIQGENVIELDRADGRAFVEAYVDAEANRLGAPFRDALYAQTGGHALFTVEILRNLQESGEIVKDEAGRWTAQESLNWGPLPARVEGAIAERIERLPAACRHVLACASVQGDDFSGELAAELAGAPAGDVLACLSDSLARQHHLVRPEGLQYVNGAQQSNYRFTHHLFQKYLYSQLDSVERERFHAALAAALERQAAADPAAHERLSQLLAWHYEAAGRPLQAARALYDAGRQAMRVSAYPEALNRYERALELLAHTPPSPERTEFELLLQVAQLGPRRNAEGMAGPWMAAMLARIAAAGVNETQGWTKLMALETKIERLIAQGKLDAALGVAAEMRDQAAQTCDDIFVAVSLWQFGFIHNLMGRPQEAEHYLDRVLTWLTPERRTEQRAALGADFATPALCFSALDLWWLGFPEQALVRSTNAVTGAQREEDTFGLATACAIGATVLFLLRADSAELQDRSELCHRLSQQHGFAMWQVYAEVFLGRLTILRGEDEAGLQQMLRALAAWQAIGMTIGTDVIVLVLADSCLAAAQRRARADPAQGEGPLSIALASIDSVIGPPGIPCGQSYAAELYRIRGELLLARDGPAADGAALNCFRTALALAQEQGALAWELRATMSLVQLRVRQGERYAGELEDARRCLRALYTRFTEGFAFPDLQEAVALLTME